MNDLCLQCADVHMVSDSEGDDFEDASEFGVDDSEMFGMGSSTCRKSPMSMSQWISSMIYDYELIIVTSAIRHSFTMQCSLSSSSARE